MKLLQRYVVPLRGISYCVDRVGLTCAWISVGICFTLLQCWRGNVNNLYVCLIHLFIQKVHCFTTITV